MRRWHADATPVRAGNRTYRVIEGRKGEGDLVLQELREGRWVNTRMPDVFLEVDFYTENEDHLRRHRPFWKQNGSHYFWSQCMLAIKEGWKVAARRLERERADSGTSGRVIPMHGNAPGGPAPSTSDHEPEDYDPPVGQCWKCGDGVTWDEAAEVLRHDGLVAVG